MSSCHKLSYLNISNKPEVSLLESPLAQSTAEESHDECYSESVCCVEHCKQLLTSLLLLDFDRILCRNPTLACLIVRKCKLHHFSSFKVIMFWMKWLSGRVNSFTYRNSFPSTSWREISMVFQHLFCNVWLNRNPTKRAVQGWTTYLLEDLKTLWT